jgi:4-hydroxy-tetrahydrodipicolinate reductase
MVKVAIAGAAGRMGRTLVQAVHAQPGMQLVGAVERPGMELLGADAGELAGVGPLGVKLVDSVAAGCAGADLLIDFTAPVATLAALPHCVAAKCGMVIGTTGIDAAGRAQVQAAAQHIPIMFAPNMSVGVNVLFSLVTLAAKALGEDFDIEVIEAHHKHKVDAPSGTAVKLGELMAEATGRDYAVAGVHGRVGQVGARTKGEIGFHAVRGGDIVGDHTVLYAGTGERIEITHRATSRTNFADGAMRAARWLAGRPAGLYDMQDVLGLR